MSKQVSYKPNEVYSILKDLTESNDKIIAKGGVPVSISLVGTHGIGKTTICRELATDLGRGYYKLNLAQLTEPSELIGFYSKEYELKDETGTTIWVTENLIPEYSSKGWNYTGGVKTRPCPPDWVVGLKDRDILILDDYSRSNSLFSQAVMELVNEGTMIGWDLKSKRIQIILSENPDSGEYNVASQDGAQNDRMLKLHMVWDSKDWAERAEKIGLDERLINFVLWMPEFFENKKKDGISASNNISPRMMDKFFSLVSTIDDFEKHLDKISLYGSISVGNEMVSQLTNFINKKLDKLPSINYLIKEWDEPTAKRMLTECCGNSEVNSSEWKGATAAILCTRMYNYVKHYHKDLKKEDIKRYGELVLHTSFGIDQKYLMVKQVIGLGNQYAQVLAGDPRFIKYMTTK